MSLSSKIVSTVNPDLVDINFGCPVKKVVCKGAGAGVLKDVNLMIRLTKAVIDSTDLPVTVKTRLGWDDNSINIDEVAERLQDIGVAALSIHARTRAQMYKGHSDWSHIARVKENPRIQMPIFGEERIDAARKHLLHSIAWKGEFLGIVEMRRHNTNYFRGIPHIKEFRKDLVSLKEKDAILEVLQKIEAEYKGFQFQLQYGIEEQKEDSLYCG